MELLIFQDSASPECKCQRALSYPFIVEDGIWGCVLEDLANYTDGDRSGFECLIKKRHMPTKYLSTATGSKD